MDNPEYMITCPRCGNEFKSTSRYCMKCGYMNPGHPSNQEYFEKYDKNDMEEYRVSGYTGDVIPQANSVQIKRGEVNLSFSSNVGSFTLCFVLNFLCYLLSVIGITYLFYITSSDIYSMIGSELSYVLLVLSIFSLIQYSTQLVYMKMDKKWFFALIPLVNLYVFSDALNRKKYMNILVFIPVIGQFYLLYLMYKMGKAFKKNGFLTMLFPFIMIPIIGFGGSCFNDICYISEKDSLEKEYGKKKSFWVTCFIVMIASIGMFIYSNAVNINNEVDRLSSYYLYYASQKAIKRTQLKVESGVYQCTDNSDTMYFYFVDLYDFIFLPFYVFRDPIEAYIKVVATTDVNGETKYDYYISMTDLKYGYPETPADEVTYSTIREYTSLDTVYENGNRCEFRRNA